MQNKTGFRTALGYSLPKEDKILVRKGLPKELKKKVLAHEEEHIIKGEEGPGFLGSLIGGVGGFLVGGPAGAMAGASIGGGIDASMSADDAIDAQVDASNQEIAYARETRDLARSDQQPYISAGHTALSALMDMTGLSGPRRRAVNTGGGNTGSVDVNDYLRGWGRRPAGRGGNVPTYARAVGGMIGDGAHYRVNELGPENIYSGGSYTRDSEPKMISPNATGYVQPNSPRLGNSGAVKTGPNGYPAENPGGVEGGYSFKTDPGYEFRFSEGMRALDRGAASRGGLLSGGYGRRAIRYGQDYASQEYSNVYNRISNIAGLGQVSGAGNANVGAAISGQVGDAYSTAGAARASGYTAQGNIWGNVAEQVAKLPWGSSPSHTGIDSEGYGGSRMGPPRGR